MIINKEKEKKKIKITMSVEIDVLIEKDTTEDIKEEIFGVLSRNYVNCLGDKDIKIEGVEFV